MPKILTQAQIDTFHRDGCVFPIRVMSTDEALAIRKKLETFEAAAGGPLKGDLRHKSHLLFPWLDEVVHIPGTHLSEQIPHRDTFARNNLLTRGQEVAVDVDPGRAVTIELEPGEISLHHVRLVHGSPPNPSNDRRIGFAVRYIPTSVSQVAGRDSASLVRGTDRFRHFDLEPRPGAEMDPAFVKLHKEITERNAQILYRGTAVKSYNDAAALPERAAT